MMVWYALLMEFIVRLASSIIISNGLDYFEINLYEKKENKSIEVLFQVNSITAKYTNQINIVGNSRTLDYVIRRELDIIEGDPIFQNQIPKIREKLTSLNSEIPAWEPNGIFVLNLLKEAEQ